MEFGWTFQSCTLFDEKTEEIVRSMMLLECVARWLLWRTSGADFRKSESSFPAGLLLGQPQEKCLALKSPAMITCSCHRCSAATKLKKSINACAEALGERYMLNTNNVSFELLFLSLISSNFMCLENPRFLCFFFFSSGEVFSTLIFSLIIIPAESDV